MKHTLYSQINSLWLIAFSGLPGRYRIPESTWFLSAKAAIKSSSASLPFSAPGPLLYPLWPHLAGLVRVTPGELQEVDDAEELWIQESGIGWAGIFRKKGERKHKLVTLGFHWLHLYMHPDSVRGGTWSLVHWAFLMLTLLGAPSSVPLYLVSPQIELQHLTRALENNMLGIIDLSSCIFGVINIGHRAWWIEVWGLWDNRKTAVCRCKADQSLGLPHKHAKRAWLLSVQGCVCLEPQCWSDREGRIPGGVSCSPVKDCLKEGEQHWKSDIPCWPLIFTCTSASLHLYKYWHGQTCAHATKHFNFYYILVYVCVFVYMHMCHDLRMEIRLVRISSIVHQVGSRNWIQIVRLSLTAGTFTQLCILSA